MTCVNCKVDTKKYKCPRCEEFYCSINCYKIHKNEGCEPKVNPQVETLQPKYKAIIPFTTEDTVGREKLEALRNSEGLKNLLYNPHLRALLKEIDEAPSAWKAMRIAMQEPLLIEFADECLKVVEPEQNDVCSS